MHTISDLKYVNVVYIYMFYIYTVYITTKDSAPSN